MSFDGILRDCVWSMVHSLVNCILPKSGSLIQKKIKTVEKATKTAVTKTVTMSIVPILLNHFFQHCINVSSFCSKALLFQGRVRYYVVCIVYWSSYFANKALCWGDMKMNCPYELYEIPWKKWLNMHFTYAVCVNNCTCVQ